MKTEIRKILSRNAERLIEEDPETYFKYETDCGYYNNGVGYALCAAPEKVYDEDRAYEDAKENLISDIEDDNYDVFAENSELRDDLIYMIRRA